MAFHSRVIHNILSDQQQLSYEISETKKECVVKTHDRSETFVLEEIRIL
jgi:hypothetical protein